MPHVINAKNTMESTNDTNSLPTHRIKLEENG